MTEEFVLSNESIFINNDKETRLYFEEDVKEFIRLLKERFENWGETNNGTILEVINKLAGEELI